MATKSIGCLKWVGIVCEFTSSDPSFSPFSQRLMQMWRMMYECHQVQNHVAQQVNLLDHHLGTEPTTDSHRHATAQLETEVTSWYSSFCNLLKSQREYMSIINQWVRLTDCLPDSNGIIGCASSIHGLCEELQCAFDRLPDKVLLLALKYSCMFQITYGIRRISFIKGNTYLNNSRCACSFRQTCLDELVVVLSTMTTIEIKFHLDICTRSQIV